MGLHVGVEPPLGAGVHAPCDPQGEIVALGGLAAELAGTPATWMEIRAGTLRLTLSKDILDHLVTRRLLDEREVRDLFHAALIATIDGGPQWFERFTADNEAVAVGDHGGISGEIDAAIGLSEATRYVQLGAPERISIGSRELVGAFFRHLPRGSAGTSGEEAAGPMA